MFCPKCGTNVPDEFNFCFKCGFNLGELKSNQNSVGNDNLSKIAVSTPSQTNEQPIQEQTTFQGNQSEGKVNFVLTDNNPPASKFNLTGSLEDLTAKYNEVLLLNHDFSTASDIAEEYIARFGNEEEVQKLDSYDNLYGYLFASDVAASQSFIDTFKRHTNFGWTDGDFNEDLEQLLEFALTCVADGYWQNCFGLRHFYVRSKQYEMNAYFAQHEELTQSLSVFTENSQNYREDALKAQIEQLEKDFKVKYGCDFKYEAFAKITSDACDLEHIQIDLNNYLEIYSYYISDIYKWILNNAMQAHNAPYLQKLFPTREQENQYAGMVQNKLRAGWGIFTPKIAIASRSKDKLNNMNSQINKMRETFSEDSFAKDALMTLGLGILSGPMGLVNAARKGYQYYNTDEKIDSTRVEMGEVYNSFCQEIDDLNEASFKAFTKSFEGIEELNKKYLRVAITNIFITLKKNGEQLLPLSCYIKP